MVSALLQLFVYYDIGVVYVARREAYVGGGLLAVAGAAAAAGGGVVTARSAWVVTV